MDFVVFRWNMLYYQQIYIKHVQLSTNVRLHWLPRCIWLPRWCNHEFDFWHFWHVWPNLGKMRIFLKNRAMLFFTLIVPQLHAEFQKNRWSGFRDHFVTHKRTRVISQNWSLSLVQNISIWMSHCQGTMHHWIVHTRSLSIHNNFNDDIVLHDIQFDKVNTR